jgi:hypothetical protein
MAVRIEDLISMGDIDTLHEIMTEDDNWVNQLEAAEGLVKLRDKRGLEFLVNAEHNEDRKVRELVREILGTPEILLHAEHIRAEDEERRLKKMETARRRLSRGKKVFCYKMVYIPAAELMNEDPLSEGFFVPALNDFGFEGWEVVNMIPRHHASLTGSMNNDINGAYFLLKREVSGDESAELK